MRPGGYPHQQALFGQPKYGHAIALQVFYANSTFCSDSDADVSKWIKSSKDSESPFILMMDRGDCTFVSKTRRAQHSGAAGVLIADNRCLCDDAECPMGIFDICEPLEPMMADDGSGGDIVIPAFLMKKIDSEMLKTKINANEMVVVEMSWALPNPDDRVEWQLWTSAIDEGAELFKKDFEEIVAKLGSRAYFEPHYVIFDGDELRCTISSDQCGDLCTNGGRYCMPDPDNDRHKGVSGADEVKENLRQLCIWQSYGGESSNKADVGIGAKWWRYVNEFASQCSGDNFQDDDCAVRVMDAAGIDKQKIADCMSSSGSLDKDEENTLLEREVLNNARHQIVIVPSVYVNNVVERGGVTSTTVLSTICAGYAPGTQPDICACTGMTREPMLACVRNGGPLPPPVNVLHKGISPLAVVGIVCSVISFMTLAGFVYWKRTQKQMQDQVRGILAEYMPLENIGDNDEQGDYKQKPNSYAMRIQSAADTEDL